MIAGVVLLLIRLVWAGPAVGVLGGSAMSEQTRTASTSDDVDGWAMAELVTAERRGLF